MSKFPRTYKSQQLEANTNVESKTMPPVQCVVMWKYISVYLMRVVFRLQSRD